MKLNTSLEGIRLKEYQTKINWRQITNFSAAIQDNNSVYFDDTRKDGIFAHPVFPVAVTWPILRRLDRHILSDNFPVEVLLTQVHYSEHLILHRLVQPDDELTIKGSLKALIPHRAGTHAIICLEARDAENEPVFTEYVGAMLRGVTLEGETRDTELPPIPENKDSKTFWASKIHIDPERPYIYDGCTDIEFAIHTSPKFAQLVGLPGIILQGTATLAYAVRELVDREAQGNPQSIREIACRFTGMVLPSSDIQVCCTGKKQHPSHTDIYFEVMNAENKKAIRNGYIKINNGGGDE